MWQVGMTNTGALRNLYQRVELVDVVLAKKNSSNAIGSGCNIAFGRSRSTFLPTGSEPTLTCVLPCWRPAFCRYNFAEIKSKDLRWTIYAELRALSSF